jgi:hypothetical protein
MPRDGTERHLRASPARGSAGPLHQIANELSNTSDGGINLVPVQRPAEIINYRSLGTTPALLGGALAVGAASAFGLTLISSVRRRRRDVALLKTLGFTRRQLAAVVAWQSSVAVAIGVVVGVPVGVVFGRWLWDLFAHNIDVVPSPTVPVMSIVLIALGALVLANLVAAVPGVIAARTKTASLLRADGPIRPKLGHARRPRTACQAASARASPASTRSAALVGCAIHSRAYSSVAPIQSAWNIRGDSDLIRPARTCPASHSDATRYSSSFSAVHRRFAPVDHLQLTPVEHVASSVAVGGDPPEVGVHRSRDAGLGGAAGAQGVEVVGVVVGEHLDVQLGGQPVLAAEEVVDAADARPGPFADRVDRGGRDGVGEEALQGGVEDRLAAGSGFGDDSRHRR